MDESEDGRWDPPRDDAEDDEDEGDGDEDEGDEGDDERVIVGQTRFTRDDFLNARRSLPGAKVLFVFVPIIFGITLLNGFMSHEESVSPSLLITPMILAAIFVFTLSRGARRWADKAFTELHGGDDVTYRFDRHGLAVETSKRQVKVLWEVLHRALETKLAFLVYTSSNTAEIVPKRAFAASDLETLRRWFKRRIQARPQPRILRNAILLWIVLIFAFFLVWQFLDTSH